MIALRMMLVLGAMASAILPPLRSAAAEPEFFVYSIYKGLDLGNPGEAPQKDFYVNMGAAQGVSPGTLLSVHRRVATYDLLSEKLYRDVLFPIARLKVIHVERNVAVARMESMLPTASTPVLSIPAVIVGDLVELAR